MASRRHGNTVYSTTFTGTVGEGQAGIYDVAIEGMPKNVTVRIQTGPAINGTELRDATGNYGFGQFTNQIEFQDAGAALNEEMKKQVLDPVDPSMLKREDGHRDRCLHRHQPRGLARHPPSPWRWHEHRDRVRRTGGQYPWRQGPGGP